MEMARPARMKAAKFNLAVHQRRLVRALMEMRDLSNDDMVRAFQREGIKMSPNTFSARVSPTWRSANKPQPPFRADELGFLIRFFGVPEASFYRPVEIVIIPDEPNGYNTYYSGGSVLVSAQPREARSIPA